MSRPTGGADPSYLSLNSCTSADMLEASDAELALDVEKLVRRDAIIVIVLLVLLGLFIVRLYPLDIKAPV